MTDRPTRGVKILLGDPKKAIRKLSVPMIFGMLVQTLYNIIDGIWVAGLGKDALAAIGLFFPVYMIIVSLATGLSVGGSSTISRKIGAKDKKLADCAAVHSLVASLLLAFFITILFLPFLPQIFKKLGANNYVLKYLLDYSKVLIAGSVLFFFSNIASGILRGEGDTKRAMYIMLIGAVINTILDPVFIYVLKLGISGAAWATILSVFITSLFMAKWLFWDKNTFVSFNLKKVRYNKLIIKEILKVGIPSSFSQMAMALAILVINKIIIEVGTTDGVAVFTSSWRILMLGIVPLIGIAIAVTAVVGAAYGAKDIQKLKKGYLYGVKLGFFAELIIASLIYFFAGKITFLFTYAKNSYAIANQMKTALKILAIFLPGVPLGMITSSMFQGIGKGMNAFWVTFLRTIIFQIIFTYILAILLNMQLKGVWIGITIGNLLASLIGFCWGQLTIIQLKNKFFS